MKDHRETHNRSSQGTTESDLPLEDYDSLSSVEIIRKLAELSPVEVEKLCRYERANQNRKKLVKYFEKRIGGGSIATGKREAPPPGEERPGKRRGTVIGATAREDPPPGEERPEQRVP